jgi:hypothetical protein
MQDALDTANLVVKGPKKKKKNFGGLTSPIIERLEYAQWAAQLAEVKCK